MAPVSGLLLRRKLAQGPSFFCIWGEAKRSDDAGKRHNHRASALAFRGLGAEPTNKLCAIRPGLHCLPLLSVLKNKVLLFLCVCSILILIDVQKNKEGEKNPMYQNMVNSDFSIALNQTNSSVEFANSILSRDSIYVVCFDLTKEYTHSLEESAVLQNGNITDLLQQYVEPYTHLINGLDAMIQDSKSTHCLIASDIREDNDFSKSFSLLLLNTEKNKLYWFYFTT